MPKTPGQELDVVRPGFGVRREHFSIMDQSFAAEKFNDDASSYDDESSIVSSSMSSSNPYTESDDDPYCASDDDAYCGEFLGENDDTSHSDETDGPNNGINMVIEEDLNFNINHFLNDFNSRPEEQVPTSTSGVLNQPRCDRTHSVSVGSVYSVVGNESSHRRTRSSSSGRNEGTKNNSAVTVFAFYLIFREHFLK